MPEHPDKDIDYCYRLLLPVTPADNGRELPDRKDYSKTGYSYRFMVPELLTGRLISKILVTTVTGNHLDVPDQHQFKQWISSGYSRWYYCWTESIADSLSIYQYQTLCISSSSIGRVELRNMRQPPSSSQDVHHHCIIRRF